LGLLRALASTVVLVGLLILLVVTVVQLRVIITARHPFVRAIEALTATVPCSCCCSLGRSTRWPTATRRTSRRMRSPAPIRSISR
jgi:hypothetical protein